MSKLILRTTLIAIAVSIVAILLYGIFLAQVIRIQVPPEEFSAWPTEKKEAFLYENPGKTISGIELAKEWVEDPESAWFFLQPDVIFTTFLPVWLAAFLGGLLQRRSSDRQTDATSP